VILGVQQTSFAGNIVPSFLFYGLVLTAYSDSVYMYGRRVSRQHHQYHFSTRRLAHFVMTHERDQYRTLVGNIRLLSPASTSLQSSHSQRTMAFSPNVSLGPIVFPVSILSISAQVEYLYHLPLRQADNRLCCGTCSSLYIRTSTGCPPYLILF